MCIGAQSLSGAMFGEGEGRVWLHGVECTGSERGLIDCPALMGNSSCTHTQDAGIRCQSGML